MPNFKHACFVRVDDAQQIKEVTEWLEMVGYNCVYGGSQGDKVVCAMGNDYSVDYRNNADQTAIDCGSNIDLFKAITAINDENDYMQWFVSEEMFGFAALI